MSNLKFYYNGIKANGGKIELCSYSDGPLLNSPAGTLTIYKSTRNYAASRFSAAVAEAFSIENDTDSQTDYFESDRIRVLPSHPLYAQVKAACAAQRAKFEAAQAKRDAKYAAARKAVA